MPSRVKYVPKHRGTPTEPALGRRLRKSLVLSGAAVMATGIAAGSGLLIQDGASSDARAEVSAARSAVSEPGRAEGVEYVVTAAMLDRAGSVSRSADRSAPQKTERMERPAKGSQRTERREAAASKRDRSARPEKAEPVAEEEPRSLARRLMPEYGLSSAEFSCLDALWVSESDWDMHADNPTSTAYGIPQALQSAWDLPADYRSNAETQIRWGLDYIRKSYGTACSAWEFKQANNWY